MRCRSVHKPSRRAFLHSACALAVLPALAQPSGSRILYVASEGKEHDGLPRGVIETYRIERGVKTLLARQAMSLSATQPRALVISPDGRHLIVAAFGGGIYNVFPIERDGTPGTVTGIFKELGSGPHPIHQTSAHPHSLLFDNSGRFLLASDLGCDRVSAFTLSAEGQLARVSTLQLKPGIGPGALTFLSSGAIIQVKNELTGGTSSCRFNPLTGELT